MAEIFVSYGRKDLQQVQQIVQELGNLGLDFWMDTRNLKTGDLWTKEIVKGINDCNAFLLFLSINSMSSDNVRREVQLAFEKKKSFYLLRLDNVQIPEGFEYMLAGIQWTDYASPDWKMNLARSIKDDKTVTPMRANSNPNTPAGKAPPVRADGVYDDFWFVSFATMGKNLSEALDGLATEVSVITEQYKPLFTSRRFIGNIKHIWEDMMRDEYRCSDVEGMAAMRVARREALSALVGRDLTDFDQIEIDAIVEDPRYLWFLVGLSKMNKKYQRDFDRSLDARAFIHDIQSGRVWIKPKGKTKVIKQQTSNPDEIYAEYKSLLAWITQIDTKAREFIAKMDKETNET
jgi:hypothetical protein